MGSSGLNEQVQGTGNYTLEILSNMSQEVGMRKTICPDTGPSVVPERDPNGANGKVRSDPTVGVGSYVPVLDPLLFQGVGTLRLRSCIPIRGGHIGASITDAVFDRLTGNILNQAEADGIDNFEFSVDPTPDPMSGQPVSIVAFFLTPTNLNNNYRLFIDEPPTTPQGSFTRLADCRTVITSIIPSTPITACAVTVPPSRSLRVGVSSRFICAIGPCDRESNYSLDIIAVVQPSIPVSSIGTAPLGGGDLIQRTPGVGEKEN